LRNNVYNYIMNVYNKGFAMSKAQKSFGAGAILSAIFITVFTGVISWMGNQTFHNTVDKERIVVILDQQRRSLLDIKKSISKISDKVDDIADRLYNHDSRIMRLEDHNEFK